jgi:hypothetical protein
MTRFQTIISTALFSLAMVMLSPSNLSAQVFAGSSYKAEVAILSAGSRAAAISRLKAVPSVGVVNLSFRNVPRFRTNAPDVSDFKISAGKHIGGIRRLRAALAANPATRRALSVRGISVNRVVGVDIYSNGSIRLYIL